MNSGGITQTTATAATTYTNGFVFEGIFGGLAADQTLFELWDTVALRSIYQVRISSSGKLQVLDTNGTLAYDVATSMGLNQQSTYITFSHAPGATPTVQVDGGSSTLLGINAPFIWNAPTKWIVGAHLIGSTYSQQVGKVKAFKIHLASSTVTASFLQNILHANNYPIVNGMYAV